MIDVDEYISFPYAVEQFLLMEEEKRELVVERLTMLLDAALHAEFLDENQTTH